MITKIFRSKGHLTLIHMLDDYQIYQNAMIRGMPLLMLSHSKVKGSKGLRKLPMPHIDLKVLAGHSFKFVQFT